MLIVYDNYYAFLAAAAFGSGFFPIGVRNGWTAVAELTDEHGRIQLYLVGWVTWVLAMVLLALVAWATAHWLPYVIATTIPNLAIYLFIRWTPESPRLRLTQGRVGEAEKIIARVMRANKQEIPDGFREQLDEISGEIAEDSRTGIKGLFSTMRMAKMTLIFAITLSVNDFFYIGGQLNTANLPGNQFVNFAAIGLTELPSAFIGKFFMNRMGRRWLHVVCHALTALLFGVNVIISPDPSLWWLVLAVAMAAKTVSNVGWFINYVQTMECYPTCARVSGMNFCTVFSTVLSIFTPSVVFLGDTDIRALYGIFAAVGVFGTLVASLLPESFKEDFPECIEDLEKKSGHPYFSWFVWNRDNLEEDVESDTVKV